MEMRKVGVPALDKKVVDRLLDLLSHDDEFRSLFVADTLAALVKAGYVPPAEMSSTTATPALCLWTSNLASKEKINRERAKLERTLNSVVNFDCPKELQAD